MAGARLWSSIRAALRRRDEPLFLNDSSAFDFSDEAAEDCPRFNKLRVVVSDDVSDAGPEPPANGAHLGPPPDRDSLLLRGAAPGARPDPCHGCRRQRERGRQAKVKRRLSLAAVLYLLFMAGELVGECARGGGWGARGGLFTRCERSRRWGAAARGEGVSAGMGSGSGRQEMGAGRPV